MASQSTAMNGPDGDMTAIDLGGGLEVLSDTQGVDFAPYLQRVLHNVKHNWNSIIPSSAMPPLLKRGKVSIEFVIIRNGQIAALHYVKGAGDVALDRAAYGGITASTPFSPLPAEFQGQYLALRMTFLYNPLLTGISPSHVQVPVGSSLQFSPLLKENDEAGQFQVTWSIVGPSCEGVVCGTISDKGLYNAPLTVPKNPTVTVKAKAEADLGETVSTVVTIVPTN